MHGNVRLFAHMRMFVVTCTNVIIGASGWTEEVGIRLPILDTPQQHRVQATVFLQE